jgi:hypothetical protein
VLAARNVALVALLVVAAQGLAAVTRRTPEQRAAPAGAQPT